MTDITFRNAKMELGQLIIDIPPEHRGSVMKFLRTKKDRQYSMTIKEYQKKRSLDANAYAWVLINKLADAMRIPPVEVYRQAIQNIGGNNEVIPMKEEAVDQFKYAWQSNGIGWICRDMGKSKIPGYRNLLVYYGSSVYSGKQMAALIDALQQDCAALDIEYLDEDKLGALLTAWEGKGYS